MREVRRILFPLRMCSGGFEADSLDEFLQILKHSLIKPIKLRALLLLQGFIPAEGLQQAGGEGSINPLE